MKKLLEPSLVLLILLVGFPQLSETIYTPSLPDLAAHMGVGNAWVNLTLSIYFVGFALGVLLWGRLSDCIGRRPAMLWGLATYILGCLLCFASHQIAALIVARFIQAFGASAGSVVTQTIMRDIYTGARRSQVFSVISAALAFTPALGPFLGGYIDELWGFYANFIVLFIMGILLFIYTMRDLPETRSDTLSPNINMWSLFKIMLKDTTIWHYAFLIGASNGIIFSYYGEAPFLFIEVLGFTPSQYGMFGLTIAIPIMLASILSHRLNRKMASEQVILYGSIVLCMGTLLLLSSQALISKSIVGCLALVMPMMIVFLGIGMIIPNSISMALSQYKSVLGSAGALFGLIYYVMIAAMTELMGVLHDGGVKPMAGYFLILAIIMTAIALKKHISQLVRHNRNHEAKTSTIS